MTADQITARVEDILNSHDVKYDVNWTYNGSPFITQPGSLTDAASKAIKTITGLTTELSTSGGTSDARFIAPTGAQVVELGPSNKTIHKINESVNIADLESLVDIYALTLENLLACK